MLNAVIGEDLHPAPQPLDGAAGPLLDVGEQSIDLSQVARGGEREQLLLGGEVAIDDGLVHPHAAGDAVDPGVLHPTLVEQRAGRVHNPALARAPGGGARLWGAGHGQTVTDGVTSGYR
jgi:hypothetical protein